MCVCVCVCVCVCARARVCHGGWHPIPSSHAMASCKSPGRGREIEIEIEIDESRKTSETPENQDNKDTLWTRQIALEIEWKWDVKDPTERASALEHLSATILNRWLPQVLPLHKTQAGQLGEENHQHHCWG